RRIDDVFVGLEALALLRGLLDSHTRGCSFVRPARHGRFGHGGSATRRGAGSRRCPPASAGGGLLGPPGHGGGLFVCHSGLLMARFSSHGTCVGLTSLVYGSSETPGKNTLPTGERLGCGDLLIFKLYSTFSAEIKALRRRKIAFWRLFVLHFRHRWLIRRLSACLDCGHRVNG